MKTLIAEDDFTSRKILQNIFASFGECDIAVNGLEAVKAFDVAWAEMHPYNLICMDIMMPEMDGLEALKTIRAREKELGVAMDNEVKVVMVTALGDPKTVIDSYYRGGANAYVVKPIDKKKLLDQVHELGLF